MLNKIFANNRDVVLYFAILLWYIASIQCYQYVGFPYGAQVRNIASLFSFAMLLYCIREIFKTKQYGPVSYIAIGVFVSLISSVVFWDSSIYYSIVAQTSSVGLMYVVAYFALQRWNVQTNIVESVLKTLAIIYILCWLYSLYKMPEMIFGIDRDDEYGQITSRGFYRLFIPGNVSAILTFYFLYQFLTNKEIWAIIMAALMIVVVILHVGRQMIVWTLLISALMVYSQYKKHLFYLICAVFVGYFSLMYVASEIPAVSALMEMSETQAADADDDIRVRAIEYFITEYPHNLITTIWGNGAPAAGSTLSLINSRAVRNNYYLEDVGFVAMYCNYGLWGVLFSLLLLWRVIRLDVEPQYKYLKYYIYYEYGVYLFSQALTSSFFPVMMVYYILEKSAYSKSNQTLSA